MPVRVKNTDKGLKALRARLAQGGTLTVGIHAQEGAEQHEPEEGAKTTEPVTVLDVASWNEFGLGVPERSFLRAWFDETTDENRAAFRRALTLVVKQGKTLEDALTLVGLRFVGKIQQRIAQGIDPANAQSTIDKKGSSKPLIDTGQLRQSITFKVTPGTDSGDG